LPEISKKSAYAITACLMASAGMVIYVAEANGVSRDVLLRDGSAELGIPIYVGLISEIGVALLLVAASVLAAALYFSATYPFGLVLAAIFSFVLAIDDKFMLHDRYFQILLGMGEKLTYAIYAFVGICLLWTRLRQGGVRNHQLLLASIAFLGASVTFDVLLEGAFTTQGMLEDLFKLAGWSFWALYWVNAAGQHIICRSEELASEGWRDQSQFHETEMETPWDPQRSADVTAASDAAARIQQAHAAHPNEGFGNHQETLQSRDYLAR